VKTVRNSFRNKTIGVALAVVLSAASSAPMVGPAYASDLDADDVARVPSRADRAPTAKDSSFIAALSDECPDILANPSEYEDTLIALCLKAWRRP
jgi:hypothetical protein